MQHRKESVVVLIVL